MVANPCLIVVVVVVVAVVCCCCFFVLLYITGQEKNWDPLVQWASECWRCFSCPTLNSTCPLGKLERTERTSVFYGLSRKNVQRNYVLNVYVSFGHGREDTVFFTPCIIIVQQKIASYIILLCIGSEIGYRFWGSSLKKGAENNIFWSEIGSGF